MKNITKLTHQILKNNQHVIKSPDHVQFQWNSFLQKKNITDIFVNIEI